MPSYSQQAIRRHKPGVVISRSADQLGALATGDGSLAVAAGSLAAVTGALGAWMGGFGSRVLGSIRGFAVAADSPCWEVRRVIGTDVNLFGGIGVTAIAAPVGFPLPFAARLCLSWALKL